jgi:2'-5' RNA ligase
MIVEPEGVLWNPPNDATTTAGRWAAVARGPSNRTTHRALVTPVGPTTTGGMTALPTWMTDRWQHRVDPAPGEGTVYWHMPMHEHPQVINLASDAQQRLASFAGLHMTPLERLHITTMVAGPASSFTDGQLDQMASTAADLLADTPPITVSLGRVLYHPEAIVLAVSPGNGLAPVRDAALTATRLVTGHDDISDEHERWIPHITVCYSTARQPAAPLIAALGESLPRCEVHISALSLVI